MAAIDQAEDLRNRLHNIVRQHLAEMATNGADVGAFSADFQVSIVNGVQQETLIVGTFTIEPKPSKKKVQ